jgi:hypothetical protein
MNAFEMPSRQRRLLAISTVAVLLSACANSPNGMNSSGGIGNATESLAKSTVSAIGGPLIPDAVVTLGPSVSYPLEKLVYWGTYAAAAWLILDPLAPNWAIEEARFPGHHVRMNLAMKRYYAGGAGEARVIFHRRAKDLMRAGGYASYEVVEYSEGMESSVLGSQRTAEGVVRFVKKSS